MEVAFSVPSFEFWVLGARGFPIPWGFEGAPAPSKKQKRIKRQDGRKEKRRENGQSSD